MPCISEPLEDNRPSKKELDAITADLCKVMKIVESSSPKTYAKFPQRIRKWHEGHKKFDSKRKLK